MPAKKAARTETRSHDVTRGLILQYFYDRNAKATSARGKRGYAVMITDVRRELKELHGLSAQEVIGNLNYLISQGWVEEEHVEKSVPLRSGTVIPQSTSYFKITAEGIDKIEGPGEYTMDKFRGIRIEATGRNIITVGDGNQVNAHYEAAATALVALREALLADRGINEAEKLDAVADIDSIESQLAKATPNKTVIRGAWESLQRLDTVLSLNDRLSKASALLAPFLS